MRSDIEQYHLSTQFLEKYKLLPYLSKRHEAADLVTSDQLSSPISHFSIEPQINYHLQPPPFLIGPQINYRLQCLQVSIGRWCFCCSSKHTHTHSSARVQVSRAYEEKNEATCTCSFGQTTHSKIRLNGTPTQHRYHMIFKRCTTNAHIMAT